MYQKILYTNVCKYILLLVYMRERERERERESERERMRVCTYQIESINYPNTQQLFSHNTANYR